MILPYTTPVDLTERVTLSGLIEGCGSVTCMYIYSCKKCHSAPHTVNCNSLKRRGPDPHPVRVRILSIALHLEHAVFGGWAGPDPGGHCRPYLCPLYCKINSHICKKKKHFFIEAVSNVHLRAC